MKLSKMKHSKTPLPPSMDKQRQTELLSPAGSMEKLAAALAFGADAVYFAGGAFGMRARAQNFTESQMESAFSMLRSRGKKGYVTVNVLPTDEDMKALPPYLEFLESLSADGIILSDLGVLALAKKHAPSVPIHISTQASIRNSQTAAFWVSLGAKRLVLARELSLDAIANIRANLPPEVELEAFVHGAMCVSFSGRCLLSNYMAPGRDANRGDCAQPCRWQYALQEEKRPGEYFPIEETPEGTYILNSKDLCMIEHLPQMAKAGISSFKIEGRVKSAYYTAVTANAYRLAIDGYARGEALSPVLRSELETISHRPYTTGFYLGDENNAQSAADGGYLRASDVIAVVAGKQGENGLSPAVLKNKFSAGEKLTLLRPQSLPEEITASALFDEELNPIPEAKTPDSRFFIRLPAGTAEHSLLRRDREETQNTNLGEGLRIR